MFGHSKVSYGSFTALVTCHVTTTGLKRLDTGAFVKDYEGADKESEQAVQMTLSEVASEDPRFTEKEAPPLSEEFPEGSKIFFLGEHAYGVAAQVSGTTEATLSVILAVGVSSHLLMIIFTYSARFSSSSHLTRQKTTSLRILFIVVFRPSTSRHSK
jgi:hypothetical protein